MYQHVSHLILTHQIPFVSDTDCDTTRDVSPASPVFALEVWQGLNVSALSKEIGVAYPAHLFTHARMTHLK